MEKCVPKQGKEALTFTVFQWIIHAVLLSHLAKTLPDCCHFHSCPEPPQKNNTCLRLFTCRTAFCIHSLEELLAIRSTVLRRVCTMGLQVPAVNFSINSTSHVPQKYAITSKASVQFSLKLKDIEIDPWTNSQKNSVINLNKKIISKKFFSTFRK